MNASTRIARAAAHMILLTRTVPLSPASRALYNRARDLVRKLSMLGFSVNQFEVVMRFLCLEEMDTEYMATQRACEKIVSEIVSAKRAKRHGPQAVCAWLHNFFSDLAYVELTCAEIVCRFEILKACRRYITASGSIPAEFRSKYTQPETNFLLSVFGIRAARQLLCQLDNVEPVDLCQFVLHLKFMGIPKKFTIYEKTVLLPLEKDNVLYEAFLCLKKACTSVFTRDCCFFLCKSSQFDIYAEYKCSFETLRDANIFHTFFSKGMSDRAVMQRLHHYLRKRYKVFLEYVAKFCVLHAIYGGVFCGTENNVNLLASASACKQMLETVRDFRAASACRCWNRRNPAVF